MHGVIVASLASTLKDVALPQPHCRSRLPALSNSAALALYEINVLSLPECVLSMVLNTLLII